MAPGEMSSSPAATAAKSRATGGTEHRLENAAQVAAKPGPPLPQNSSIGTTRPASKPFVPPMKADLVPSQPVSGKTPPVPSASPPKLRTPTKDPVHATRPAPPAPDAPHSSALKTPQPTLLGRRSSSGSNNNIPNIGAFLAKAIYIGIENGHVTIEGSPPPPPWPWPACKRKRPYTQLVPSARNLSGSRYSFA